MGWCIVGTMTWNIMETEPWDEAIDPSLRCDGEFLSDLKVRMANLSVTC